MSLSSLAFLIVDFETLNSCEALRNDQELGVKVWIWILWRRLLILRASFSKNHANSGNFDREGREICSFWDMLGEITPKTHPEIFFEEFRLFWSEWTMKISGHFQWNWIFGICRSIILCCQNFHMGFYVLHCNLHTGGHLQTEKPMWKFWHHPKIQPKVAIFTKNWIFVTKNLQDPNTSTWVDKNLENYFKQRNPCGSTGILLFFSRKIVIFSDFSVLVPSF